MEIFEKDLKMVSGPSMNIAMSSVTMDMLVNTYSKFIAWIELATPGSAVRLESVPRHVTDCPRRPGRFLSSCTQSYR